MPVLLHSNETNLVQACSNPASVIGAPVSLLCYEDLVFQFARQMPSPCCPKHRQTTMRSAEPGRIRDVGRITRWMFIRKDSFLLGCWVLEVLVVVKVSIATTLCPTY